MMPSSARYAFTTGASTTLAPGLCSKRRHRPSQDAVQPAMRRVIRPKELLHIPGQQRIALRGRTEEGGTPPRG